MTAQDQGAGRLPIDRASRYLSPFVIGIALCGMLAVSWAKWPDVLIDFGRELYVPWQISQGRMLYTDLAYFNGPLSPYLNALWLRLGGVGLDTLVAANLLILIAIVILLHAVVSLVGSRLSATVACLVFVLMFACAQYVAVGNYNYVAPYSHELTHGMALALAAVLLMGLYLRSARLWRLAASGAAVGLLFLTKPEMFTAGGLAVASGLGLWLVCRPPGFKRAAQIVCVFAAAAVVPPAVAFGLLCLKLPAGDALVATLGGFAHMTNREFMDSPFFAQGMGTDNVAASLRTMAVWTLGYAGFLAAATAAGFALRNRRHTRWTAVGAYVVAAGIAMTAGSWKGWFSAARPLTFLMVIAAVGVLVFAVRSRGDAATCATAVLQWTLVVLAGAMLGKMLLNVRIYHYGFALAMPAVTVLVVAFTDWLPRLLTHWGAAGGVLRWGWLGVLTVAAVTHVRLIELRYAAKTVVVSHHGDTIVADDRGRAVNDVLARLDALAEAGATLVVMPEGVTLNFLARRANPTPYINFIPPEVIMHGEDRMLAALEADPPDFIAWAPKDTREYGFEGMGIDYGTRITAWVGKHYRDVDDRAQPERGYHIRLLQRADAP